MALYKSIIIIIIIIIINVSFIQKFWQGASNKVVVGKTCYFLALYVDSSKKSVDLFTSHKGRYVRRCLVRAMYLSTSEVGLSYLGRYTKCSTFYLYISACN